MWLCTCMCRTLAWQTTAAQHRGCKAVYMFSAPSRWCVAAVGCCVDQAAPAADTDALPLHPCSLSPFAVDDSRWATLLLRAACSSARAMCRPALSSACCGAPLCRSTTATWSTTATSWSNTCRCQPSGPGASFESDQATVRVIAWDGLGRSLLGDDKGGGDGFMVKTGPLCGHTPTEWWCDACSSCARPLHTAWSLWIHNSGHCSGPQRPHMQTLSAIHSHAATCCWCQPSWRVAPSSSFDIVWVEAEESAWFSAACIST